jgi:peptide/nickel transport system substrate-binding protein
MIDGIRQNLSYLEPGARKGAKADGAKTKASYESYMKKAAAVLQKDAYIVPILAKAGVGLWQPDLKGWKAPRIFVEQNFADLSWK